MSYSSILTKDFKPRLKRLYKDIIFKNDKDYFPYSGIQIYTGMQGSGKTISAVNHTLKIKQKYKKLVIVSNLDLLYFEKIFSSDINDQELKSLNSNSFDTSKKYIYFKTLDDLSRCLTLVNNEKYGVLYLIDEIQTYFNSLESKSIPIYIFTEISQQRKQRKLIIGTSQLFQRTAKPFREQADNVILCSTFFGFLTYNRAYKTTDLKLNKEGERVASRISKRGFFTHSDYLRSAFDTYQKVITSAESINMLESSPSILELKNKKFRFK